jgi:NAD(P)-dependent dehydrogenase (short-subunit alcohol dehydrogenase family)
MNNRTVVVTGAGGTIGFNTVEHLLSSGHKVFACVNSKKSVERLGELKKIFFESLIIFPDFDLSSEISQQNCLAAIKGSTKHIDVLINIAGKLSVASFFKITQNDIKEIFEVNFFGAISFSQKISKLMLLNKNNDRSILFVSSVSVKLGTPGRMSYCASKGALESSVKVLCNELGAFGIRVNAVSPGLIESEMLFDNTERSMLDLMVQQTPLKRLGKPKDVSNVILFLISEAASFVSGQVLSVDGGI